MMVASISTQVKTAELWKGIIWSVRLLGFPGRARGWSQGLKTNITVHDFKFWLYSLLVYFFLGKFSSCEQTLRMYQPCKTKSNHISVMYLPLPMLMPPAVYFSLFCFPHSLFLTYITYCTPIIMRIYLCTYLFTRIINIHQIYLNCTGEARHLCESLLVAI